MLEFLTLKPQAFGLDISDLSLKIIQLKKSGRFLNLASFGEELIEPGLIKEGEIKKEDEVAEAIKYSLSRVQGEKIKTKYVVASLPEEKAFLQVIKMPRMSPEDLESAVVYEAENYIPLPIEEVYLDSQIVHPVDHLKELEVLIAALPRSTVDPYISCLKKAGLKTLFLEIESLAIARALIKDEITTSPVILIDLGATRTSFIIFSGRSARFTSSVPVSSQVFTRIIAKTLNINLAKAEKLKREVGLDKKKEGGRVFEALIPALTDLIQQIEKYVSYYQTHDSGEHLPSKTQAFEKIILCGGGANLGGLPEFLSEKLETQVEIGDPWINVMPEEQRKKIKLPPKMLLSYTTAIGLALRGARKNEHD